MLFLLAVEDLAVGNGELLSFGVNRTKAKLIQAAAFHAVELLREGRTFALLETRGLSLVDCLLTVPVQSEGFVAFAFDGELVL